MKLRTALVPTLRALYGYVFPIILAFACLFRSTFASFGYLVFFVGVLFIRPSVYRPKSSKFVY